MSENVYKEKEKTNGKVGLSYCRIYKYSKQTNKTKQNINKFIEKETKGIGTRREEVGGWVKKVKGIRVNNTVISLHSDR